MRTRQELHAAYVLHTRPFRETSMLVEILSAEQGRLTVVARGAKRGKSKISSLLQPFLALKLSWYGDGDLVTLVDVEACQPGPTLSGRNAICGLYLNELLVKLLPRWDSCTVLYNEYEAAIVALAAQQILDQIILRKFEMQLLKSMGYALQLHREITTGMAVHADQYYVFDPEQGPRLAVAGNPSAIKGASLLALAAEAWQEPGVLLDIKRLMRVVLRHHLGARQLISRELL